MVGINIKLDKPTTHTVEITLFGGGGGYGESVLIHLGNDKWMVVDCCVDSTKHALPLSYLEDIGCGPENIINVICTHWHSDHIMGMSEILSKCNPANTIFYTALTKNDNELIAEFIKENMIGDSYSYSKEFLSIMNVLNERHIETVHVSQDKLICNAEGCLCYTLSPSDEDVNAYLQTQALNALKVEKSKKQKKELNKLNESQIESAEDFILDLFPDYEDDTEIIEDKIVPFRRKRISLASMNDRSVAILLSIGEQNIILGADLENDENDDVSGWGAIMRRNICLKGKKADVYKIPHHGSITGYAPEFIEEYVHKGCLAKMTTWHRGGRILPQEDMLTLYLGLTDRLYITSRPNKPRKIDAPSNNIRNLIEEHTEDAYDIPQKIGFIRSRLNLEEDPSTRKWETQCFGSAYKIECV